MIGHFSVGYYFYNCDTHLKILKYFTITLCLFHPAVMVEHLKLQQDPCYPVKVPDDPLGLWCREHSRMLHMDRTFLYCAALKKIHWNGTIQYIPNLGPATFSSRKVKMKDYLLKEVHGTLDPAGQLPRPQDAACHWGQVPADWGVYFLFHVDSGDHFNVLAIVL